MSLETALAERSDEDLAILVTARPEVLEPAPPRSFSVLAGRLSSWPSLTRCLESLDRFAHQLLSGLCLLPEPASAEDLAEVLGAEAAGATLDDVSDGLGALVACGLAWADGTGVHLVDQLRRALARPAGLGPPLAQLLVGQRRELVDVIARNVGSPAPKGPKPKKGELVARLAGALSDPATVSGLLAEAPTEAAAMLDRLQRGGGAPVYGSMYWHGQSPRTPLEWLQSRGMVVTVSWNQVEVPREVGLALRGGRPYVELTSRPPELVTEDAGAARTDAAAAAADVLAGIEALCAEWGRSPAGVLKAGGLGARELKRAARATDRDQPDVALLAELALAAGLLTAQAEAVLPTAAFDHWLEHEPADRWLGLLRGWLASDRWPSLAGRKDTRDKPIPALHPGNHARQARDQRSDVLAALATLPEGRAATLESLADHSVWMAPRRWDVAPARPVLLVRWVLEEAAALGATCGGAVGGAALGETARALLSGDEAAARAAAQALLPSPTTELTLQADLTALAVGTLHPTLASELHLAADVESKGAATVFRFSEASIGRALDAGRSAEGLLDFLSDHATKGVPQPLAYLVADVGRRHGVLRAGTTSSYLRSDDPALVAQALRSRRAAALGLRQLAPTVVVADAPVSQVLAALRADGLLPAQEGADGAVLTAQAAPRRADPAPSHLSGLAASSPLRPEEVHELVERLRAAPAGSGAPPAPETSHGGRHLALFDGGFAGPDEVGFEIGEGDVFADDPDSVFDLLLDAVAVGCPVLVGHEDPDSGYLEEVIEIVNISNGVVFAHSSSRGGLCALQLASIEWAQLAGDHTLSVQP